MRGMQKEAMRLSFPPKAPARLTEPMKGGGDPPPTEMALASQAELTFVDCKLATSSRRASSSFSARNLECGLFHGRVGSNFGN